MAFELDTQGDETEDGGLHLGLDLVKEESVLEPSLAKITLCIPAIDSGDE